jgi:tRNA dimethylallyltransferase
MNGRELWIVGPTAVGKSAVALALASRLDAEIVSADSMQVYRGMDIGTAKPTSAERAAVVHHLLDVCPVDQPFDAKQFVELAGRAIADIQGRGKTALIVGGTGMYVRALRQGLFDGPARDPVLRERLDAMTAPALFEELTRVDPATAARIDRHNPRRLVRALEVFYIAGQSIGALQTQWSRAGEPSPVPLVCLNRDRPELHKRIERRIDQQLADGWLDEVRQLMAQGIERNPTALQAAGYRELVAHLRGDCTLADAVARIKARTRQLAKRQLTWFRREPDLVWVEIQPGESPGRTANALGALWRNTGHA